MELTLKNLKKLAKICKQEGIKNFKGYGVEFTLDDSAIDAGVQEKESKKQIADAGSSTPVSHDIEKNKSELTPEQLLFFSATGQQDLIDQLKN